MNSFQPYKTTISKGDVRNSVLGVVTFGAIFLKQIICSIYELFKIKYVSQQVYSNNFR